MCLNIFLPIFPLPRLKTSFQSKVAIRFLVFFCFSNSLHSVLTTMTLATSGAKGAAMVTLLLVAMTVVCVPGAQPRSFTQTEIAQLDRFVMEVMRCARIPALSLSLVSDDDVVYEKGYGTANPTTRTPTTKDTVFCLGSFTQSFTSVLLADLLSRNEK